MVSSSRAMWQRRASRSGLLGLGGGGFGEMVFLGGLLGLEPIDGRGGAGCLLGDGCFGEATFTGMLLAGPGGGGAGRRCSIKRGGGGRGGGVCDSLFVLICCSPAWLLVAAFGSAAVSGRGCRSGLPSQPRCVCRNRGKTKHRGALESRLPGGKGGGGVWGCKVGGALSL